MNSDEIAQKKNSIIEKYGDWTAHNIQLEGDLYTIDNKLVGDEVKLRRIIQIVSDITKKPLNELRVLDLACLEGLYSVEFALRGADVVGVEGRESNIEKAKFAKEVLSLDKLELIQNDVRNLDEKLGKFDVILCLGILYHLEFEEVVSLVQDIQRRCSGIAIFDTHISLKPEKEFELNNKKYWGLLYNEHAPDASEEEKKKALWASLDNLSSFWPTRSSLCNILSDVGFTTAYECYVPHEPGKVKDRVTMVALCGDSEEIKSSNVLGAASVNDMPESEGQGSSNQGYKKLVPKFMKDFLKKLIND